MTHTGKVKLENNHEKKNVLCNKGSKINTAMYLLYFLPIW